MTATRVEDEDENAGDLLDSAESNFLAREQAVLGDDAQFFQSASPAQGEDAFFGGASQGHSTHLISPFHSV